MSGSLTVPPGGDIYEKEVVDIRSVLHSNIHQQQRMKSKRERGMQQLHFSLIL
jgi:hypothetical protein